MKEFKQSITMRGSEKWYFEIVAFYQHFIPLQTQNKY